MLTQAELDGMLRVMMRQVLRLDPDEVVQNARKNLVAFMQVAIDMRIAAARHHALAESFKAAHAMMTVALDSISAADQAGGIVPAGAETGAPAVTRH